MDKVNTRLGINGTFPCASIDINSWYDVLWAATADQKSYDKILACALKEKWWIAMNVLPPAK